MTPEEALICCILNPQAVAVDGNGNIQNIRSFSAEYLIGEQSGYHIKIRGEKVNIPVEEIQKLKEKLFPKPKYRP